MSSVLVIAQVSDTDFLQQLRAEIQTDRRVLLAAKLGRKDAEAFWPICRQ